jgi:hypothetical protein
MGSLIAGMLTVLGTPAGLAGDAPDVPSTPVEIGTSGTRRAASEVGSWQVLLLMFVAVLVLGAVVLMYAARQRARLVERRRVRRMGDVAAWVAAMGDPTAAASVAASTSASSSASDSPSAGASVASQPAQATPPRTTPTTPDRPSPNA